MSTLCGGGANSGGYIDVKRNCKFLVNLESGNENRKRGGCLEGLCRVVVMCV